MCIFLITRYLWKWAENIFIFFNEYQQWCHFDDLFYLLDKGVFSLKRMEWKVSFFSAISWKNYEDAKCLNMRPSP